MLVAKVWVAFVLLATAYAEVVFPSGEIFEPITDISSLGSELQDPKNTGSQVYDSEGNEETPLSLNFGVDDWKSPSNRYFRAHPEFMECLQRSYNVMRRDEETVEIEEGYRTSADSPSDVYLQTGAAAVIKLAEGGTKTIQDLAAVVIEICVPIFQEIHGDIGLVLYADKLQVQLQGADDTGPNFRAESGASMDTATFQNWAWGQIDETYEPISTPECVEDGESDEEPEPIPILASGDTYPAGSTPEDAAGSIDYPVTRDKVEDFKRLVQYPANNIIFDNEERTSAWCGSEDRGLCVDCSSQILGSAMDERCTDRVMTKSLMNLLIKVQRMVQDEWTGVKLKVLEAWDEPHAGATSGDQPAGSLHYEGRAAKLTLSDGDAAKLPELATFCICVGAHFVEHKGDHIFIAVRKQEGFTPTFVDFPEAALISVTPPADLEGNYTLPEDYNLMDNDNNTMPMLLFDSDRREDMAVGGNVTIGDFKDPAARYFRLNPVLVECYEALALRENKWIKPGETYRHIHVLEGYLTTEHQDNHFNMSDPRYDRHNLGWAMRVGYYGDQVDDPEVHSPLRLAKFAVIKCGPLFDDERKSIGVGMYNNSVYVDVREDAKFWVDNPDILPVNVTAWEWEDEMAVLLNHAIEGRIIEPDSLDRACLFSDPPARQSVEFEHKHSEFVERRRRRRQTEGPEEEECIPRSDTEFCTETAPHRETEIKHIWGEVKQKHLYRKESDVREALEGCFGACGTCLEGEVWEEKTKHCNNFMHWVNFDFMNDAPDVTNFWARDNVNLKVHACRDHCIVKAPLFSLLAPSTEELYRPDPAKSVQEQIYSMANNPSPVMDLMQMIYGTHASGRVEFYVEDAAEMNSLRDALKAVLVFNKNVTEVLVNAVDIEAVEGVVQNLVFEWTKSSCPDHTREFITPFSVVAMPAGISKRSPEFDVREEMLERHRNWEHDWISSGFN